MQTRLILIRHGATDYSEKAVYCGSKDAALNSRGKKQAQKLRKKFKNARIDAIYASNKKRAMQTARIIFGSRHIIKMKELREINFGLLEGLTYIQALEKWPVQYRKWLKDPLKNSMPRAERLKSFQKRVNTALKKIVCCNYGKTVAVVCHGGSIRELIGYFLKPAGVRILKYENK